MSDPLDEQATEFSEETLEVMANPFRMRAYDTLLVFGDMTARQAARLTRMSEASLNHHMRQLAKIGHVQPVNPEAPRRQIVWHAVRRSVRLKEYTGDDDYADVVKVWSKAQIEAEGHVLQEWADVSETWPSEWLHAEQQFNYVMYALTAEQLEALGAEIRDLVARWQDVSEAQRAAATANTQIVYVATHAMPWPVDYSELEGDAE